MKTNCYDCPYICSCCSYSTSEFCEGPCSWCTGGTEFEPAEHIHFCPLTGLLMQWEENVT